MRVVPHGGGIVIAIPISLALWAGIILVFAGCGSIPYRQPCEYDVHVRLTEEADAECHKFPLRDHNGNRLNNTTRVLGCGDSRGIISNGTRSNMGHEQGHVLEDLCPQWAEGYFD